MEPTITELLQAGFQLMVVGMGIVFFFLALLVGAISGLPHLLRRAFGEEAFEQIDTPPSPPASAVNAHVVEAIRQAIQRYESQP